MNSRAFTLSLVIAAIAVFMAYSYIEGEEAKLIGQYGKDVSVIIASEDIKEMDMLDDRKVTTITVPKKYRMQGAFTKIEEIYNTIATVPILKGEQITAPRVTYPGARTGLARQISIGKRAMAIQISPQQAVSKLLKPGDRVDILALIDYAGGRKELLKVKTVLQDVLILSTGLNVTNSIPMVGIKVDKEIKTLKLNNYTSYTSVSVELSPFDVQKLVFLIQSGSPIYLSLRNNDDKTKTRLEATKLFEVLGDEDRGAAQNYFAEKEAKRNQRSK